MSNRVMVPASALLAALALVALSAAACLVSAQDVPIDPVNKTLCELVIQGSAIERLELQDKTGRVVELGQPDRTVTLPAGEYRVREVRLRGGYHGRGPAREDSWFLLTPDEPCELQVGAPLRLRVKTGRRGRFVTMDYELSDAAGCRYYDGAARALPKFHIYKDGAEVGSGSFEYG